MTPDQRLDYFRSEISGEIAKLAKEIAAVNAAASKRCEELEKKYALVLQQIRDL
jgi:hypothetical protein